jgi:hypothetical protein
VKAARSAIRGRPPLGLGRSGGTSGAMIAQSASVTSGLLMPLIYHTTCSFVRRSKLVDRDVRTVRRWVAEGKVPARKVGCELEIELDDLARMPAVTITQPEITLQMPLLPASLGAPPSGEQCRLERQVRALREGNRRFREETRELEQRCEAIESRDRAQSAQLKSVMAERAQWERCAVEAEGRANRAEMRLSHWQSKMGLLHHPSAGVRRQVRRAREQRRRVLRWRAYDLLAALVFILPTFVANYSVQALYLSPPAGSPRYSLVLASLVAACLATSLMCACWAFALGIRVHWRQRRYVSAGGSFIALLVSVGVIGYIEIVWLSMRPYLVFPTDAWVMHAWPVFALLHVTPTLVLQALFPPALAGISILLRHWGTKAHRDTTTNG